MQGLSYKNNSSIQILDYYLKSMVPSKLIMGTSIAFLFAALTKAAPSPVEDVLDMTFQLSERATFTPTSACGSVIKDKPSAIDCQIRSRLSEIRVMLTVTIIIGLNADVNTYFVEEYINEKQPSNGEIYCKMKRYHFQRNVRFEMRWKARKR